MICDKFFLPNLLVLIDTLKNQKIHVLCLDDFTSKYLSKKKFKKIKIYEKQDIEKNYNLENNKQNPYYVFLLKPVFIHYLFKKILKKNNFIIYLDADICFFSSIKKFLKCLDKRFSIFLTPHNFSKKLKTNIKYGKFNAGFIALKKNIFSEKALIWWMKSCIKECTIDLERNLVGDQFYLNSFPKKFKKLFIFENLGINCAPWNVENGNITYKKKQFYLEKDNLFFFHFQGLRRIISKIYFTNFSAYKIDTNPILIKLYISYINKVEKKRKMLPHLKNKSNIKMVVKAFAYRDYIIAN